AIRAADERAGPALDVRQQPLSRGGQVFGEFPLGDRAAVAGIRPQGLVRVRDRDAEQGSGTSRRSRGLPPRALSAIHSAWGRAGPSVLTSRMFAAAGRRTR